MMPMPLKPQRCCKNCASHVRIPLLNLSVLVEARIVNVGKQQPDSPETQFVWKVLDDGEDGPGPRSRHGLVYDRTSQSMILFSGIVWADEGWLPADTWEFDGDNWVALKPRISPPGRHRGAMTYDSLRQQAVLFGGQGSSLELLSDTWLYADRQWQKWPAGWWTAHPSPRCGHCLTFDESVGAAVLFGGVGRFDRSLGDTWLFDGSRWKVVKGPSPRPRRYASMAYDPDLQGCVLHGGSNDELGKESYGDAWLFRDGTWTRLGADFKTSPRDDHGLAYHQSANCLVMLEGVSAERGILTRGSNGWQWANAPRLHPRHQCSPLVWNEKLNGLLMYGGEVRHGGPQFEATLLLRCRR